MILGNRNLLVKLMVELSPQVANSRLLNRVLSMVKD